MNLAKHNRTLILSGLVIILLSSCSHRSSEQNAAAESDDAIPSPMTAPSVHYPEEQLLFHQTNLRFLGQLHSANTDDQKSMVVAECDKSRSKFFKERKSRVSNWVGRIAEIRSENKGAWTFLRIVSDAAGFSISYQTHYQRWPAWKSNSILEKGSKPYQQASRLSAGQMVSFSGRFIENLYYKFNETKSVDLECVSAPKIIVRFSDLAPLAASHK